MILVDTSVWVDHFRAADARLAELLEDGQVLCHPFVVGELACGHLRRRAEVLALLAALPQLPALSTEDVMRFVDGHRLMGKGLGWVDVHLLAAAVASRETLWTKDRRLAAGRQHQRQAHRGHRAADDAVGEDRRCRRHGVPDRRAGG